jgi:hypothetical protein
MSENENEIYQITVSAIREEGEPAQWWVTVGAIVGEMNAAVPLDVQEARAVAREILKAAEYVETQNIGEENAEALGATEPPPEEKTDGQS